MKPVLTLGAVLLPTVALAHPGGHGDFSIDALLAHITGEPDHVALILGIFALAVILSRRAWSRK